MSNSLSSDEQPVANRHTVIGIILNLLLLLMITYGFLQSQDFKWAWAMVGVPIGLVTLSYGWHFVRTRMLNRR